MFLGRPRKSLWLGPPDDHWPNRGANAPLCRPPAAQADGPVSPPGRQSGRQPAPPEHLAWRPPDAQWHCPRYLDKLYIFICLKSSKILFLSNTKKPGNYTNKVGSSESESSSSSSSSPMKRAYSPWREEIPVERSCAQALIDDLYCACDRRLTLDAKKSPLAVNSSTVLLATLNQMLERGLVDGCSRLKLKAILRAEVVTRCFSGFFKFS